MGVYIEHNWIVDDVGIGAADLVCQADDRVPHLTEIGELLAAQLLRELGPGLGSLSLVIETKLEGAPSHQTIASRQEVETHD